MKTLTELHEELNKQTRIYSYAKTAEEANRANLEMMFLINKIKKLQNN